MRLVPFPRLRFALDVGLGATRCPETDDPWTEELKVPIDEASVLVIPSLNNTRIPLAGLKAITLDEAA